MRDGELNLMVFGNFLVFAQKEIQERSYGNIVRETVGKTTETININKFNHFVDSFEDIAVADFRSALKKVILAGEHLNKAAVGENE